MLVFVYIGGQNTHRSNQWLWILNERGTDHEKLITHIHVSMWISTEHFMNWKEFYTQVLFLNNRCKLLYQSVTFFYKSINRNQELWKKFIKNILYCDLFSSDAKYVDDVFIWPFLSHTVTRHWFIPFRLVQISRIVNLVVTWWGDSKVCGQGEKVQRFPGREIIVMWKSNDGVSLSETASQGSIPIVTE